MVPIVTYHCTDNRSRAWVGVFVHRQSPNAFPSMSNGQFPFIPQILGYRNVRTVPISFFVPAQRTGATAPQSLIVTVNFFFIMDRAYVPNSNEGVWVVVFELLPNLYGVFSGHYRPLVYIDGGFAGTSWLGGGGKGSDSVFARIRL